MPSERLTYLLRSYFSNTATEAEQHELMQYVAIAENEVAILQQMDHIYAELRVEQPVFAEQTSEQMLQAILKKESQPAKVTPFRNWRAVAAAILLLLTGGTIWYMLSDRKTTSPQTATVPFYKNDVQPGDNKATLTLANGQTIILDTAANGKLAQEAGTDIQKQEGGSLVYNNTGNNIPASNIAWNTLTVPRGGQFNLVLPDGSKVWLNAASSIHYPASFAGKERRVDITGEVYFEVAKNASMPFIVAANDMEVKVLGTHFNINAYDNENYTGTTLLEGAVEITKGQERLRIAPGQQARTLQADDHIQLQEQVDTDEITAWKNGQFSFGNADLKTIMRQVERWYNVAVIYQTNIREQYTISIPRNVTLSKLLRYLELSGGVHFVLEGNTITIKS